MDLRVIQPFLVGLGLSQRGFDLLVPNNAAFLHIDQEHFSRLQAPLLHNLFFGNVQYAHFRTHNH